MINSNSFCAPIQLVEQTNRIRRMFDNLYVRCIIKTPSNKNHTVLIKAELIPRLNTVTDCCIISYDNMLIVEKIVHNKPVTLADFGIEE